MSNDREIARAVALKPIREVAAERVDVDGNGEITGLS
jgi:hypothetical protein